MIQRSEILVVVPAYNESANIEKVVTDIHQAGFSCVVVDDGSEDTTSQIARNIGANVLTLPYNVGVGGALRCGFRYALENNYKAVIQCDADGQHQSHLFNVLIDHANETNADCVLGSRFLSIENQFETKKIRRIAMRYLASIASAATGIKITDSTSGFRLIRRPLLDQVATKLPNYFLGDTFEFLVTSGRSGYQVEEVATAMLPRQFGVSSVGGAKSVAQIAKACLRVFLRINFRIEHKLLIEQSKAILQSGR